MLDKSYGSATGAYLRGESVRGGPLQTPTAEPMGYKPAR